MKIACLQFNPIQENTYVVWDDTLEAVVIPMRINSSWAFLVF